jgi:hypothetical protein
MKAVYIGAGTDLSPIQKLTHIKDFVYIDGQPFSEFGTRSHKCDPSFCSKDCIGFSRPSFLKRLKDKMEKINMNYKKISDNEIEFTNETQRVTYFINTAIPDHIERVKDRINNFDNLIVVGHIPDSIILNYTTKPLVFWGNTNTSYTTSKHDEKYAEERVLLCYRMHRELPIKQKFYNFNLIKETGLMCFTNWSTFVSYTTNLNKSLET